MTPVIKPIKFWVLNITFFTYIFSSYVFRSAFRAFIKVLVAPDVKTAKAFV